MRGLCRVNRGLSSGWWFLAIDAADAALPRAAPDSRESERSESPVCCVISSGTPTLEGQKYPAFLPGSLNIPGALLSMSFTLFYLLVPLLLLPPI